SAPLRRQSDAVTSVHHADQQREPIAWAFTIIGPIYDKEQGLAQGDFDRTSTSTFLVIVGALARSRRPPSISAFFRGAFAENSNPFTVTNVPRTCMRRPSRSIGARSPS